MNDSSPLPALGLLPEVEVRAALGGETLRLRLLRPAYPALGVGTLRALRVAERDGFIEIVAGYEGYEPIERAAKRRAAS